MPRRSFGESVGIPNLPPKPPGAEGIPIEEAQVTKGKQSQGGDTKDAPPAATPPPAPPAHPMHRLTDQVASTREIQNIFKELTEGNAGLGMVSFLAWDQCQDMVATAVCSEDELCKLYRQHCTRPTSTHGKPSFSHLLFQGFLRVYRSLEHMAAHAEDKGEVEDRTAGSDVGDETVSYKRRSSLFEGENEAFRASMPFARESLAAAEAGGSGTVDAMADAAAVTAEAKATETGTKAAPTAVTVEAGAQNVPVVASTGGGGASPQGSAGASAVARLDSLFERLQAAELATLSHHAPGSPSDDARLRVLLHRLFAAESKARKVVLEGATSGVTASPSSGMYPDTIRMLEFKNPL